ncbi:MAG: tail fiber domain-containing protein [Xanthobacteraceae bacterium]|nr:tail fiber domain-containing protein [Xanthobacteraceae bacterium]
MGGTSTSSQTQSSSTTPWSTATPALNGILGGINALTPSAGLNATEQGAIDQLVGNAKAGNPYAGAIGAGASSLLGGGGATANNGAIGQNLASYRGLLAPYAGGAMVGNNAALQSQLDTAASDATNRINGEFAAAGRDLSPGNSQALARGITQAQAPIIAGQYNQDVANQLAAANSLYGAGNATYGLMNDGQAAANANIQNGAGLASTALAAQNYAPNAILNAEQQAFAIPAGNYATLLGAVSPVAQSFGTTTGTGTGSQTESGAQQFGQLASGFGSLLGSNPSVNASGVRGGGSALLGLLGLSDRRLKQDIERVGTLFDGTPVYRFRYIGHAAHQIGLMAQDVEQTMPGAVVDINGIKAVDYRMATERAARMEAARGAD